MRPSPQDPRSAAPAARTALAGAAAALMLVLAAPALAQIQTTRVSVQSNGGPIHVDSRFNDASGDGRYVAFLTSGLAAKSQHFVYVRDTWAETTKRASITQLGLDPNASCTEARISDDGRYVAFQTKATNFPGDGNGADDDVYVRDMVTGTVEKISVDAFGGSPDQPVELHDLSADGRYVLLRSHASDLVSIDNNSKADIFLRDRLLQTTTRVSFTPASTELTANTWFASMSSDSRYVVFIGDAQDFDPTGIGTRVVLHDRLTGLTTVVPATKIQTQRPYVSDDGRWIVFVSIEPLVPADQDIAQDAYVYDVVTGTLECLSPWAGSGTLGGFSRDGKAALVDTNGALDPLDTNTQSDAYRVDVGGAAAAIVSLGAQHQVSANGARGTGLSADGATAFFESRGGDLVANDANGSFDVFARGPCPPALATTYGSAHGPGGGPQVFLAGPPLLGSTTHLVWVNSAGAGPAALVLGVAPAALAQPSGATLLVTPLVVTPLALPSGVTSLPVVLPSDPALCGFHVFLQGIAQDPASGEIGFSAGLDLRFG